MRIGLYGMPTAGKTYIMDQIDFLDVFYVRPVPHPGVYAVGGGNALGFVADGYADALVAHIQGKNSARHGSSLFST